jgi:hypothetical protein
MGVWAMRPDTAAQRARCPLPRNLPYLLLASQDGRLLITPFRRTDRLTLPQQTHLAIVIEHVKAGAFLGACWLDADTFKCSALPWPDDSWVARLVFDRQAYEL